MSNALSRHAETIGVTGLFLFSFFAWLGKAGANFGLFLMFAGVVLQARDIWQVARRDAITYVAVGFTVILIVQGYLAAAEFPQTADEQWDSVRKWSNLWFFLPVAWWMAGRSDRVFIALGLALLGFTLRIMIELDPQLIAKLEQGYRYGFGMAVISAGLVSGLSIIGLTTFAARIWSFSRKNRVLLISAGAAWLVAFFTMLEVLLLSQSRAAWIATAVGLCVVFSVWLSGKNTSRFAVTTGLVVLIGIAAASYSSWNTVERRFEQESATLAALQQKGLRFEDVPYTSAGQRIHMIHFGFKRWQERPWFGWGPGSVVTQMFEPSDFPDKLQSTEAKRLSIYPHLHNGFLGTFVRLGLVGGGLLCLAAILVLSAAWQAYRQRLMPVELFTFLVAATVSVLLWNVGSFRLIASEYRMLVLLLAGAAYTYHLSSLRHDTAPPRQITAEPPLA